MFKIFREISRDIFKHSWRGALEFTSNSKQDIPSRRRRCRGFARMNQLRGMILRRFRFCFYAHKSYNVFYLPSFPSSQPAVLPQLHRVVALPGSSVEIMFHIRGEIGWSVLPRRRWHAVNSLN